MIAKTTHRRNARLDDAVLASLAECTRCRSRMLSSYKSVVIHDHLVATPMAEQEPTADVTVNAIGSSCPGPLMELIGKAKHVDEGTVVRLQSSNDQTEVDVEEWTEKSGNELLDVVDRDDHLDLYVEVR
jgi:TusA-related sulfurtransferase